MFIQNKWTILNLYPSRLQIFLLSFLLPSHSLVLQGMSVEDRRRSARLECRADGERAGSGGESGGGAQAI